MTQKIVVDFLYLKLLHKKDIMTIIFKSIPKCQNNGILSLSLMHIYEIFIKTSEKIAGKQETHILL